MRTLVFFVNGFSYKLTQYLLYNYLITLIENYNPLQIPRIHHSILQSYQRVFPKSMKKASNYAFLSRKRKEDQSQQNIPSSNFSNQAFGGLIVPKTQQDLNVFVVTFDGMKAAEQNLSGGDPYECKKCNAVLNKYSKVLSAKEYEQSVQSQMKAELKPDESFWECEFCLYPNILQIQKEEIPKRDDVVYMLESAHQKEVTENDSTIVFCIDTSGSMNTTSQIEGKVDLKFGMSQEEIQMLKQFMEPGDEAQFNFLPGNHNKNKTFISRKQCILSAIESQLQELKKIDPLKKVGFVTFNNEVTVLGDGKAPTVNILGDKLNKKDEIVNCLNAFKLIEPLGQSYDTLINSLNKTQAKGQTALGPALLSSIEVASKGSPGSSVVLCTDGLANIGVGSLDPFEEANSAFYRDLAKLAKERNIIINLITIKGESAKMQVIGQLAKDTNGNIKVVNPEKLKDDFANVLKDEVVGLNVSAKIMLHKAMTFRNEAAENLKDNGAVMVKELPNATVNTRISFEYELRVEEDLKFMEIDIEKLNKVPFQAQIIYTSPKGGKFLRVISSQSQTTTQKQQMKKDANIGVVHQRIASNTAAMFSKGDSVQSMAYNDMWSNYLNSEFVEEKYSKQQQSFNARNVRLRGAVEQRSQRMMGIPRSQQAQEVKTEKMSMPMYEKSEMLCDIMPRSAKLQEMEEEKPSLKKKIMGIFKGSDRKEEKLPEIKEEMSEIKPALMVVEQNVHLDSDEEEQELAENLMEKQCFDLD